MKWTVLADLWGSRAAEAALLHLFHYGESHGRAVSRDFSVSLDSVQRQLDRFERTGILVCKSQGRTLVYSWNGKSRLAKRMRELVDVAYSGLSAEAKSQLFSERRQPRAKDKPVIR